MMRAIGVVTTVVLIGLIVAWMAGWVDFSSESRAGSSKVQVEVDRDEARRDWAELEREARELFDGLDDDEPDEFGGDVAATDADTSVLRSGVVASADFDTGTLVLTKGGERLSLTLADDVAIVDSDGRELGEALAPGTSVVAHVRPGSPPVADRILVVEGRAGG